MPYSRANRPIGIPHEVRLYPHGHFYQPPRENPSLEAIELQDSAAPYHDWNERVTAECYAPNAVSRVLDAENRILKLINNYSQISFNFGPTLLSWLKTEAARVYQAIRSARSLKTTVRKLAFIATRSSVKTFRLRRRRQDAAGNRIGAPPLADYAGIGGTEFAVLHLGDHNITVGVKPVDGSGDAESYQKLKEAFSGADTAAVILVLDQAFDKKNVFHAPAFPR